MRPEWLTSPATSFGAVVAVGVALRVALLCYGLVHDQLFRVRFTDVDYLVITDAAEHMLDGLHAAWTSDWDLSGLLGNWLSASTSPCWPDGCLSTSGGGSPFDRATYRYSPLMAVLVMPGVIMRRQLSGSLGVFATSLWFGKAIFCLLDVLCGTVCYDVAVLLFDRPSSNSNVAAAKSGRASRPAQFRGPTTLSPVKNAAKIAIAACVLWNPLMINICSRGNCDTLVALLCLLMLRSFLRRSYVAAGLWCGLAVHVKIYPIIYAAALVFALWYRETSLKAAALRQASGWINSLRYTIVAAGATIFGAGVPTLLSTLAYGHRYIDEALLYHVGRLDHRHNLSFYFYGMYLATFGREASRPGRGSGGTSSTESAVAAVHQSALAKELLSDYTTLGSSAFLPQVAAMLVVAWSLRANVGQALAIQTVVFVAFNKVSTVQYFAWYLPFIPFVLIPLMLPAASGSPSTPSPVAGFILSGKALLALWVIGFVGWLLLAKQLEFDGEDRFFVLWLCSLFFFVAHVLMCVWGIAASKWHQRRVLTTHLA